MAFIHYLFSVAPFLTQPVAPLPTNGYTTENNEDLVAEDGVTFYVQEV